MPTRRALLASFAGVVAVLPLAGFTRPHRLRRRATPTPTPRPIVTATRTPTPTLGPTRTPTPTVTVGTLRLVDIGPLEFRAA